MPTYIVTCKSSATDDQVKGLKEEVKSQGGTIKHEYPLIKGFAVEYPEGHISSLEAHEHVEAVEADQEVKIQ